MYSYSKINMSDKARIIHHTHLCMILSSNKHEGATLHLSVVECEKAVCFTHEYGPDHILLW